MTDQPIRQLKAGVDDNGRRIDRVVRRALPQLGLSQLHRALRVGDITLNGKRCKACDRVAEGDLISLRLSQAAALEQTETDHAPPQSEPLIDGRIILENSNILALHKRRGTLVHGEGSLNDAVNRYLSGRLPPSLSFRPGPLHRLDRNSSGVILFGKSLQGSQRFSELLKQRRVTKSYLGLFCGSISVAQCWRRPLRRDSQTQRSHGSNSGATAQTLVQPLAHGGDRAGGALTLALCQIHSGRTHQIRAHAAAEGYPLAGDSKYGGGAFLGGYILHALSIELDSNDTLLGFSHLVDPPEQSVVERVERFLGQEAVSSLTAVVQGPPIRLHCNP